MSSLSLAYQQLSDLYVDYFGDESTNISELIELTKDMSTAESAAKDLKKSLTELTPFDDGEMLSIVENIISIAEANSNFEDKMRSFSYSQYHLLS